MSHGNITGNRFAKKVFGNDQSVLEAVHHYLRELPADQLLIEDEPGRNIEDGVQPGGVADLLDHDDETHGGGLRDLATNQFDVVAQDEDAVLNATEGQKGCQRSDGACVDTWPDAGDTEV